MAKVIFLHLSVILFTGGFCLSACWDTPPGADPPDQAPPRPHPPGADTPPSRPPRKLTRAYGLRAAGTHPTGMHSCSRNNFNTGLLLREFLDEFRAGDVATSWLPGILSGLTQFSGRFVEIPNYFD